MLCLIFTYSSYHIASIINMANISELDADLGILYKEIDTDLRQNEHDGSDPCNDTKSSESEQTDIPYIAL